MDLVRPAILTVGSDILDEMGDVAVDFRLGDVAVRELGRVDESGVAVVASLPFEGSPSTADGRVEIGRAMVAELDLGITAAADMLTLARREPVKISGVWPPIGFVGPTPEWERIEGTTMSIPTALPAMRVEDPIPIEFLLGGVLSDRMEGAALLAEAMAHSNDLGRFGQLLRLLERAFGRGIGKFDGELQRYLAGGVTRHHFQPREITAWVAGRPRIMHADRPDRPIWFHRDVALTVDRLQEAAVDVLFNKVNWHQPDDARRECRVPRRGTLDASGGWFFTRGLAVRTTVRLVEPFGSFPLHLGLDLADAVPFGLWATPDGESMRICAMGRTRGGGLPARWDAKRIEVDSAKLVAGAKVRVYDAADDGVQPALVVVSASLRCPDRADWTHRSR